MPPRAPKPAATTTPASAGSRGYPAPVNRLIDALATLPGIGRRSAERVALHLLKSPPAAAAELADALTQVKRAVRSCRYCFNLATDELCPVCADDTRDRATVLVVEQPRDVLALEQTGAFRGLYHVLLGRLAPLDGISPGDLTIDQLLHRARKPTANVGSTPIAEIVLGFNPTMEGDSTALYLAQQLREHAPTVRISRLARGLPTGSPMEFASKAVLTDAIEGRRGME